MDVVGALLDEVAVVLDCGCCHGRHSTPMTPSRSNTAATETPISLRVTELAESLWAVAPSVLDGVGVTWGLRAAGAGVVGAAATRGVCGAAVSVKARAKSVQDANRSSGFLANAAARTGSSEASSGRRSARAGWCVEVAADDDRRIGVWEELRAGQQVVGGGSQGILVGSPVHLPHP